MIRVLNSGTVLAILSLLSLCVLTVSAMAAEGVPPPDEVSKWLSPAGVSQVVGTGGLVYCLVRAVVYLVKRNEVKEDAHVQALNGSIREQALLGIEVRDAIREMTDEIKALRKDLSEARISIRKESHG